MLDERTRYSLAGGAAAALVVLLFGGPLQAQESLPVEGIVPASVDLTERMDPAPPPGEQEDPPGLLDEAGVQTVADLASRLSQRRDWLSRGILGRLSQMSLRLDEVFAEAPHFLVVDGRPYRLKIEPPEEGWWSMDSETEPFAVFLTSEVYTGLGEERLLAFQDGVQIVLEGSDFDALPAFGLTLYGLAPSEEPLDGDLLLELGEPIELGAVRFRSERDRAMRTALRDAGHQKMSCIPEMAPSGCLGSRPVCSEPGYVPWFVLDSILMKVKHEARGQSPEIELYPLLPLSTSGLGPGIETNLIFSGRFAQDLAGRWRYLPDINTRHTFHEINGGIALFPTDLGQEWAALLVEDDKTTGKLEVVDTVETIVKLYTGVSTFIKSYKTMNYFKLLKAAYDIVHLALNSNGDDCFVETLGVSTQMFCSSGIGQPFPTVYTLDTTEWSLRGHFACIDPTCIPAPPATVDVTGPTFLGPWENGTFTCGVSHGSPPYTYTWKKGYPGLTPNVVGTSTTSQTSATIVLSDNDSFDVTCTVEDGDGTVAADIHPVVVDMSEPSCDPAHCTALCGSGYCTAFGSCVCV